MQGWAWRFNDVRMCGQGGRGMRIESLSIFGRPVHQPSGVSNNGAEIRPTPTYGTVRPYFPHSFIWGRASEESVKLY